MALPDSWSPRPMARNPNSPDSLTSGDAVADRGRRPPRTPDEVRALHEERLARARLERDAFARRGAVVSNARLATFLLFAGGAVLLLLDRGSSAWVGAAIAAVALPCFAALVVHHDRVIRALRRAEERCLLSEESLARLARDFSRLPDRPAPPTAPLDPRSRDLDLFGRASLFQLLGTTTTPSGRACLARWLLEPAAPDVVRDRQDAVRELAPRLDLRQELELRGRLDADLRGDLGPFFAWAEGEPWLERRPLLLLAIRLLSGAAVLFAALHALGLLPLAWLPFFAVNLLLGGLLARRTHATFDRVSSRERVFRSYAELFSCLIGARLESHLLQGIQAELCASGLSPEREMTALDRILSIADVRRSGLLHLPLEGLLLYDLHVLDALERWQRRAGRAARRWLELLGEVEALAALAGLLHDNPGWTLPEITPASGESVLSATALGHPLLPPGACVPNDVTVGPAGTFLLVTGSNMSGKSTLLRAIGVNTVLAQAGGPVCAASLRAPPLELGTSFRLRDSLEEGVSFFMAELRRLKEIVDAAAPVETEGTAAPRPHPRLLFLLDEILLGTNVTERQIAVRQVLLALLERGAVGAVSTHDLTLATAPGLEAACRPVHFRESFESGEGGPRMTFDYRLRGGVAPTTNALKLLELVGLGDALIASLSSKPS
jgi:hypothetical protein